MPAGEPAPAHLYAKFSALQAAPSTSVSASGSGNQPSTKQREELERHPFYRFPTVLPGVTVRELDWYTSETVTAYYQPLKYIRALLKKEVLSYSDAVVLHAQTERLLSYAKSHMLKNLGRPTPSKSLDRAARMLLVLDTLFTACSALGQRSNMDKWWPSLMATVPRNVIYSSLTPSDKTRENLALLKNVLDTIEIYRAGTRPAPEILVPLKIRILCSAASGKFAGPGWKAWREDDKEWRESCLFITKENRNK